MNQLSDKELVKVCLEEVRSCMGNSSQASLTQRDYEYLCEVIQQQTGILISLSTMKRLFAGRFERLPQVATLNALTVYAGYEGWQDFKTKKSISLPVAPSIDNPDMILPEKLSDTFLPKPGKKKAAGRVIAAITACLFLSSIAIFVFLPSFKNKKVEKIYVPDKPNRELTAVTFSARKTETAGVPNTVIFSYNIDHLAGDSFFIQQSWDSSRRVAISKHNYTLTDIYYEPGFHKAKLIRNDSVIKEIPVDIPTANWIAYVREKTKPLPQYIHKPVIHQGQIGLMLQDLKESGIDLNQDQYFFYTHFPEQLHVSSENFVYKARVRMRTVQPTNCPVIGIGLYAENSIISLASTIPGCVSEIMAMFGDKYLNGKTSDLSGFGKDVFTYQTIEIHAQNRKVRIFSDSKLIFQEQYSKPIGMLKGLAFVSNGLCEVSSVNLADSTGNIAYASGTGLTQKYSKEVKAE